MYDDLDETLAQKRVTKPIHNTHCNDKDHSAWVTWKDKDH